MTDECLGAGTLQESVCIAHMEHPILACKVWPVGEAVAIKKIHLAGYCISDPENL